MEQYYGTGRRKEAVARVFLRPGNGKVTVNGQDFNEYFQGLVRAVAALEPLRAVDALGRFDAYITVRGGGKSGQIEAQAPGLPHPGRPRGGAEEVRQAQGPPRAPVLQALSPGAGSAPGASPGRFSFGPSPAFWRTPP